LGYADLQPHAAGIGERMNRYPSESPLPSGLTARMNRLRLASEASARVMEEIAKKAADVRTNMARLRELRLAKEAQEVQTAISVGNQPAKAKLKRRFR